MRFFYLDFVEFDAVVVVVSVDSLHVELEALHEVIGTERDGHRVGDVAHAVALAKFGEFIQRKWWRAAVMSNSRP